MKHTDTDTNIGHDTTHADTANNTLTYFWRLLDRRWEVGSGYDVTKFGDLM